MIHKHMAAGPDRGRAVAIEVHPAERGAAWRGHLYGGCGCSCCCCCLHTIGGVAGAVMGHPGKKAGRTQEETYGGDAAVGLYWQSVLLTSLAAVLLSGRPDQGLFGLVLAFPVVQLVGGVIALFIALVSARAEHRRAQASTIRSMMGKSLLGAIIVGAPVLVVCLK